MQIQCPLARLQADWEPCIKEKCAWWLEDVQMCALKELALETRYTQFRLQEIKDQRGGS